MKILYEDSWCVFGATDVTDETFPPLSYAADEHDPKVKEFFARLEAIACANGIFPQRIVSARLSHSSNVELVTPTSPVLFSNVDGFVTAEPGTLLAVTGADCPPVFVADPVHHAIGIAHSGRKGTQGNIVRQLIEKAANAFDATPASMMGIVGPGICGTQYEVSEEVATPFRELYADRVAAAGPEKALLDLPGTIHDQLVNCGIPSSNVRVEDECTLEHADRWFSWRRDQKDGRSLEQIRLQVFFAMIR